jgi:Zn-dependent M16 (insulinase) family peptidase
VSDQQQRELRDRLDGLTIRDAARLERRLKNLRGDNPEKIAEQIAAAEGVIASRLAAVPTITYPDLPRARPRHSRHHRPHPAAPAGGPHGGTTDRRRNRHRVGRGHRLHGAVH